MRRFYNQIFHCDYQMAWSPFDVQSCKIHMTMKGSFAPFTNLKVDQVVYKGEKFLSKYEIKRYRRYQTKFENIETITTEVTLGRQLYL